MKMNLYLYFAFLNLFQYHFFNLHKYSFCNQNMWVPWKHQVTQLDWCVDNRRRIHCDCLRTTKSSHIESVWCLHRLPWPVARSYICLNTNECCHLSTKMRVKLFLRIRRKRMWFKNCTFCDFNEIFGWSLVIHDIIFKCLCYHLAAKFATNKYSGVAPATDHCWMI